MSGMDDDMEVGIDMNDIMEALQAGGGGDFSEMMFGGGGMPFGCPSSLPSFFFFIDFTMNSLSFCLPSL